MALSAVTITYDIADLVGIDFDARRTKVYVTTNVDSVIDTVDNKIRVGDGLGTLAADGTGSISVWVPGTGSNPATWQTYIHIDYAPRGPGAKRETLTYGPFTITAAGDLADLVADQVAIPTATAAEWAAQADASADSAAMSAGAAATSATASATSATASATSATAAQTARAGAEAAAALAEDISNIATPDALVETLIENPASLTSAALSATYARGVSVSDTAFAGGAVPDWNGATGTDNLAAFNAAVDAVAVGGQVHIPAGRYYCSDTFVIDKLIRLTTGASGIQQNSVGTEIVFAAGKTGLHVKENANGEAPHGVHIDPIQITSRSTVAGADVGILCTNGRVTLQDPAVSGFGSHGYHLKAGADAGNGNVNLSILHTPRAYGNRGDGIKLEGSDSNHIVIVRPDLTGNYGWGLNFDYSSHAYVIAPHIDHQYNGSPGAIRDYGDSNRCEWVYLETGDGSNNGGDILLYRNVGAGDESRFFTATFGFYGGDYSLTDQTQGKTHQIDHALRGRVGMYRAETPNGQHSYRYTSGIGVNDASHALIHTPDGGADRVVTEFFPTFEHYYLGAHAVPRTGNAWDLGDPSLPWRRAYFSGFMRLGDLYLRANAGVLEQSTDGSTWAPVNT